MSHLPCSAANAPGQPCEKLWRRHGAPWKAARSLARACTHGHRLAPCSPPPRAACDGSCKSLVKGLRGTGGREAAGRPARLAACLAHGHGRHGLDVRVHGEARVVQDAARAAHPVLVRVVLAREADVRVGVPAAVVLLVLLHLDPDVPPLPEGGAPRVLDQPVPHRHGGRLLRVAHQGDRVVHDEVPLAGGVPRVVREDPARVHEPVRGIDRDDDGGLVGDDGVLQGRQLVLGEDRVVPDLHLEVHVLALVARQGARCVRPDDGQGQPLRLHHVVGQLRGGAGAAAGPATLLRVRGAGHHHLGGERGRVRPRRRAEDLHDLRVVLHVALQDRGRRRGPAGAARPLIPDEAREGPLRAHEEARGRLRGPGRRRVEVRHRPVPAERGQGRGRGPRAPAPVPQQLRVLGPGVVQEGGDARGPRQ
mmetsp:Transcript_69906/g.197227  ORF Transcript_69906/g.197227 Transcript_69906/m.197227 type:complete len:421 (-) Transcript_69906:355-1617(-)